MSTAREPMRLTETDLFAPTVNEYLEHQQFLRRDVPETKRRSWIARVLLSNYVYLSLAAGLGAFVAWACVEPFIDDSDMLLEQNQLLWLGLFPLVSASIGLFLGAAEGIMCRNLQRAVICAAVGLAVGFVGSLIATIPGIFVIAIRDALAISLAPNLEQGGMPTGLALLVFMMGRAVAWVIIAMPSGIGQGIALRDKKIVLNGLLGGVFGGLIGGLLFDPISIWLTGAQGDGGLSRGVGFTTIGLCVGLFVGVVEQWTKSAWLLMKAGPLAGKQFIVYRNPTVLGSSPKADIYLFKDEAIEPRHALIHNRGGRYEIEDLKSADGTYVNGIPVQKRVLQSGDQIVLGKTVLEFTLRESS